jgi:hypothetical protein
MKGLLSLFHEGDGDRRLRWRSDAGEQAIVEELIRVDSNFRAWSESS